MDLSIMYKILLSIMSSFIICIDHSCAVEVVEKIYCISAVNFESVDILKKELLNNAKRQAVGEIFGELITAFTKVESGILTEDKIRIASAGLIRVDGNPLFRNGSNFGEVCVSINSYATQEDKKKFEPISISKKHCATHPELSAKQLVMLAKDEAITSALIDYDRNLAGIGNDLLPLVHQVNYSETGFIPETETYCVKLEGIVYPIELLIASSQGAVNQRDRVKASPIEEITEKKWQFGRGDGSVIASKIKLIPGGEIKGYQHANEHHWGLEDGYIVFYHRDGRPSCRFTSYEKKDALTILEGKFLLNDNNTIHVLKEIM